jgi:cell division protease FtsH
MTLGGRAAENVVFQQISTGAQNDLDQVTKMAYGMISVYGMNKKVGNVSFYGLSQDQFQKPYSDDTAKLIDDEVRNLIDSQYARAQELLKDKRKELEIIAKTLLDKEVILKSDVERLIGERPYKETTFTAVAEEAKEAQKAEEEENAYKSIFNGSEEPEDNSDGTEKEVGSASTDSDLDS